MSPTEKKRKISDLGWVAAAVVVAGTTVVGAVWGWQSTYDTMGLAFALKGAEHGAGYGATAGVVIDIVGALGISYACDRASRVIRWLKPKSSENG